MKFVKSNYLLIIIILVSVALRFIKLSTIPIGFNDDEAAFGYNAYSIIKSGRDEWGRLLPFPAFESFGDWKLAGYLYFTVVSQLIFGVGEFATRFPSAFFGVLSVIATYLLARELFLKEVALIAALLLAISPWHIIASRNAFESDVLIFFITVGTYLFIKGLKTPKLLTLSSFCFVLSFYLYRSAWVFLPIFLILLISLNKESLKKLKNYFLKNAIFALILLLPLVPTVVSFSGQARFSQESFLVGVARIGIVNEVNEKRGICQKALNFGICQFLINKPIAYVSQYFNNYFENLSFETYFIRGVPNGYQAFANRGLFYSFELPLLLIGIIILILRKHPAAKILIPWILIVPISVSLTGVGNPGRLNILMPTVQIIEGFAIFALFKKLPQRFWRRLGILMFGFFLIVVLTRLLVDMFFYYPTISGKYQRYGYKQLFDYLESRKGNFNEIAVSRKSDDAKQYIHYLFFEKIDPVDFNNPAITSKYRGADGWQVVEKVGKFNFYPSVPKLEKLPKKALLAVAEKEVLSPVNPIFIVSYLNGDKAFEVYDVDLIKERLAEVANGR